MDKSEMLSNLDKAWQKQESETKKENEARAKQITNELWKSLEVELKHVKSGLKGYILGKMVWASAITAITLLLLILWGFIGWQVKQKQNDLKRLEKAQANMQKLENWKELSEVEIIDKYGDYLLVTTKNKKAEIRDTNEYGKALLIPRNKD